MALSIPHAAKAAMTCSTVPDTGVRRGGVTQDGAEPGIADVVKPGWDIYPKVSPAKHDAGVGGSGLQFKMDTLAAVQTDADAPDSGGEGALVRPAPA